MVKLDLAVGNDFRFVAAEVAMAQKSAIAGQPVEPFHEIVFIDWRRFCAVLTTDRYDVLRTLARSEACDAADLDRVLGRDPRSIEADIAALAEIGLVSRNESDVVSTAVDEIASLAA